MAAAEHLSQHGGEPDLLVVAPWWRWGGPPTDPRKGRQTAPTFQKYDTPRLVDEFIKNPQHTLKFKDVDLVHVVTAADPAATSEKKTRFSDTIYVPDDRRTRKIFLDTHKRFYLVVCQIACDAPGLPKVSRDKICQVGMVVRRRTTSIPPLAVTEASTVLKGLQTARLQKAKLDAAWSGLRAAAAAAIPGAAKSERALRLAAVKRAAIAERRESVIARVAAEKERLGELAARFDIQLRLEGWFPSPSGADRIGFWDDVDETPEEIGDEASFPMYPLIPPRSQPDHSGQFGTVYFGLLPTGSRDTTDGGEPRFDDRTLYEIRVFAKRHTKTHGPGDPCPCPDGLFWSAPTAPYRLAAHFDLAGTGQQSFTVQLPSLPELAAQASAPAIGTRFVKPPGTLMVSGERDGTIVERGASVALEICFIPIPLITIVAMFVFELFLPIVMLIFGLFWMLKLKFCILPQIDLEAHASIELALDAAFNAVTGVDVDGNLTFDVNGKLSQQLEDEFTKPTLTQLAQDEKTLGDVAEGRQLPTPATAGVSLTANLQWETEVDFA